MSRTHHATRKFRLSCGCLRDFPGMPAGKTHEVLCVACRKAVTALYAYPEKCCGAESIVTLPGSSSVTHVACTLEECDGIVHADENMQVSFTLPKPPRRGAHGETRRA